MKAIILYDEERYARNRMFASMLCDACSHYGVDAETRLTHELDFNDLPDLVIRRCVDNTLTERLERCGVYVSNSSHVSRIANDKRETYRFFSAEGIKMCDTLCFDALPDICPLPYPCVVKASGGHGGSQVFKIENDAEYSDARISLDGFSAVVQPFLECASSDVRAYMLGGRLLCAVKRTSAEGFRSNYSLGGDIAPYFLSAAENAMVERVSQLLKADFIGIDFFPNGDEPILNEVEDVVGTRMLYSLGLCDAAELLAGHLALCIQTPADPSYF